MNLLQTAGLRRSDRITIPARVDQRFRGGMADVSSIDRARLAGDLRRAVEGEVRFDAGSRALYATDASNFRQPPIGVVVPRTIDDVVAAVRVCHEHGAPVLSRGAGTSLSGETVNVAVVIDHSKYLRDVVEIDSVGRLVTVQSGAVNEQVNETLGPYGLVFPPDPSTHMYCTIGGNVGNNSCGVHSVQAQVYGPGPRTSDNVHSLDVVTYDGIRMTVGETTDAQYHEVLAAGGRRAEIYRALRELAEREGDEIRRRFPSVEQLPRRVSGYNLDELLPEKGFNLARALTGTEGTCVTVLHATLMLTPNTAHRTLVVVGFEDICVAAEHVEQIMSHRPVALEAIDHRLFHDLQLQHMRSGTLRELPEGEAWLMVELPGQDRREADERAEALCDELRRTAHAPTGHLIVDDPEKVEALWKVREAGLGGTAFPPDSGDHWPGWEDSAVPPPQVAAYLRDLKALYRKHDYVGAFYGHIGQGCIHSRIDFDLRTADGIKRYRRFLEEAADLVVSYGGSLSGEHGDGQQRAELLARQYGDRIVDAFREFKRIWDPDWKMNPGKVVDPYRLDENLKLGADSNPWRPPTRFAYPEDDGDFAHATVRCVGVGKCRTPDGVDVMCPSYIVTKEEKHSTRGRARLLFEMLQGEIITDGWRSKEVHEALDLCLACKGCTSDCPVHVDMPTYKAEFYHHHYARRLRPRHAYAFGLIDQAARLAAMMPGAVNAATQTPGVARLAKLAAGMAPARQIPRFAPLTLQAWFQARGGSHNPGGRRVVLWPDTFNNHFHTDVGVASVQALEAAGWHVVMPQGHVCCGRPLYDYGFLGLAERYLRRTLTVLRDEVRAGTPVVGMEPSCLAVFKDELGRMLPHDDDAKRLAGNAYHFAEFFRTFEIDPPPLEREALLWGHCHHKATGGMAPERDLLEQMGASVQEVTGGCCGLAGSWGFEAGHHDISLAAGEHALLPAVREAPDTTLIVANGFSCKTQIAQGETGREALHIAQVMELARSEGGAPAASFPERGHVGVRPGPTRSLRVRRAAAGVAAAAMLGGAARVVHR